MSITPLKAIHKRCNDCKPDSNKEVRNCQDLACSLYHFRNGKKEVKKSTVKAIKNYCKWCCNNYNPVNACSSPNCSLYRYRNGKNPARKGIGNKRASVQENIVRLSQKTRVSLEN